MSRDEIAVSLPLEVIPEKPDQMLLDYIAKEMDIDIEDEEDMTRFLQLELAYQAYTRHMYAKMMIKASKL